MRWKVDSQVHEQQHGTESDVASMRPHDVIPVFDPESLVQFRRVGTLETTITPSSAGIQKRRTGRTVHA